MQAPQIYGKSRVKYNNKYNLPSSSVVDINLLSTNYEEETNTYAKFIANKPTISREKIIEDLENYGNTIEKKVENIITPKVEEPQKTQIVISDSDSDDDMIKPVRSLDNNQVFTILNKLRWLDRDEGKNNINKLSVAERNCLKNNMPNLADTLRSSLLKDSSEIFRNMSDNDVQNFLYHVVAKGSDMYLMCLTEPSFCYYLLDNYQNLYTELQHIGI